MKQDWLSLPMHIDMSCYSDFYQNITRSRIERNRATSQHTLIVEAGVRYGCSARIFLDVLAKFEDWRLHLIDPRPQKQALDLAAGEYRNRLSFHQQRAEAVASQFDDGSIDILHIDVDCDGTHPYELTLQVVLAYWHKLKPDAQIIFHDATRAFPGVLRVVNELTRDNQWTVRYATPHSDCPISAPACVTRIPAICRVDTSSPSTISVVVPVINERFLGSLLGDIRKNTMRPDEILVIDNGAGVAKPICDQFTDLPIRYLPQTQNLGVNASWNLGLSLARNELVSILNDDLILNDKFFEMILQTFQSFPNAGLVVPQTIMNPRHVHPAGTNERPIVAMLPQREGWAFTTRKSLAEPIPESLFTFCGDDWLFKTVVSKGYWPLKIINNRIFHHIGISQNLEERARLHLPAFADERATWQRIEASWKGNEDAA